MASKTLSLSKLVSSDFSEGSSWVLNKGGGGDTDVGYFIFTGLGTSYPTISDVSFKINAIETGGNNLFGENIYLDFEFGKYYDDGSFVRASSFSFAQQGVKESQNQVSITASASSSKGGQEVHGGNLCIKLTITPQSNSIGSKIVMSGFSLSVTYEVSTRTMKVTVSPDGAGTVKGAGTYEYNAYATLEATPSIGYAFKNWCWKITDKEFIYESNPVTFQMAVDTDIIAIFEKSAINKIYIGTSQPKEIYIGTQKVKAVYIGTTKVYG